MEQQVLTKLIDYGGAIAVIGAMTLFITYLIKFLNAYRNNKNGKDIEKLYEKFSLLEENHLSSIEKRLETLEARVNQLSERVAKLEAKMNQK